MVVKIVLLQLLLVLTICGSSSVYAAPTSAPLTTHNNHHQQQHLSHPNQRRQQPPPPPPQPEMTAPDLQHHHLMPPTAAADDPSAGRNERSTNLSHVTGTARKIQMFIKNRHLQILPDGTVNGTTDDTSLYTILQRMTVGIGQVKVLAVATCQYLCMAPCGILYGTRVSGDECVFNETIAQSNYNLYASTKHSNAKRTLYLALNRRGQSRRVLVRAGNQLGKLSSYARVLTRSINPEMLPHPMRHHAHACTSGALLMHPNARTQQQQHRLLLNHLCPKKRKRKKKKKKCPPSPAIDDDNEDDSDQIELCHKKLVNKEAHTKCDVDKDSRIKCNNKKKLRLHDHEVLVSESKIKKKNKKAGVRRRLEDRVAVITTTAAPISTVHPDDDVMDEEDYGVEESTHGDLIIEDVTTPVMNDDNDDLTH